MLAVFPCWRSRPGAADALRMIAAMVPDPPIREPSRRACSRAPLAVVLVLALAGCAPAARHEMLNAVLWQQRSAEYRALALQSYALAGERLGQALASPGWSAALEQRAGVTGLAPAVILDLDETVLDNTRYEARIISELGEFDHDSFAAWCESGEVAAVPGALGFIREARARGVRVFFYTSREERLRGCTERALEALGLGPVAADGLYLRGAGTKSQVRARIARRHRIVLLIGDSLEDFVDGARAAPAARRALIEEHAHWFGRRWIVLPNPMYGHWEAAWYGYDYRMPRARKLDRKAAALAR